MSRCLRPIVAVAALAAVAALLPASPAGAQIAVVDTTNYAQNLLQAARALEQINNQVSSLQNEAAMLRNMGKNLERIDFPELERVRSAMGGIERLLGEAQGIGFRVDQLDRRFRGMFPGAVERAIGTGGRIAEARARIDRAMDGFRHSMVVQAQVAENVREDAGLLAQMIERSQAAVGGLQAAQATNQLIALGTKQQLQLQDLLAAEFREASVERARRAQAEIDARAATRRFLGTGKAYSPR